MTLHPDTPHPPEERFHDLVDGRLSADERAAMEAHLAACHACTARLLRLGALLAAVDALPRELVPERDAWPELRATLATRAATRSHPGRAGRARWIRTSLAAAAVLLVAVTGWSVLRRATPHPATPSPTIAAAPSADPPRTDASRTNASRTNASRTDASRTDASPAARSYLDVERDYARAAAELTAQLEATRGRLSPEAVATVERSLATIDSALVEARAALVADPANPDVARFVAASYERKLAVLRRSTEISSGD